VRADDLQIAGRAIDADRDLGAVRREADALGVAADRRPPASRISRIAAETSSSSRAIRRGAFSTTVTAAPKRRKICANSRPM